MKTISKVLSMFLVVVMCFGLFATSAYASENFDFGNENSGSFAAVGKIRIGNIIDQRLVLKPLVRVVFHLF